jgi:hypothetical protein
VDPYPLNNPYHLTASERRAIWFPKLSLPVIAAYTPESWSVDFVDEAVQEDGWWQVLLVSRFQ